jgi:LysM repeat protein
MLGADQIQLNSPFGYDADYASEFQERTLSCGATGYAFTVPAPYTLTTSGVTVTTTASPTTASLTCQNPYVVKPGDSCNRIATTYNVSTFSIIAPNGLNDGCTNLVAGKTICLAQPCALYLVQKQILALEY